jgi:hypothetical protein
MAKFLRLDNVEIAARQNPDTFFLPSEEERKSQKVGDSVRLHFLVKEPRKGEPRAERMWVTVTRERGFLRSYKGTLENIPAVIEDPQLGDEIKFNACHIAQTIIKIGDPRWIDSAELMAFVSAMCFEKDEVVRFLYREKPDRKKDSGWRMFTGCQMQTYLDDPKNTRLVDVGYMLDRDPSLREPLKEGIGAVFERENKGVPWHKVTDWDPGE